MLSKLAKTSPQFEGVLKNSWKIFIGFGRNFYCVVGEGFLDYAGEIVHGVINIWDRRDPWVWIGDCLVKLDGESIPVRKVSIAPVEYESAVWIRDIQYDRVVIR